MPIPAGIVVGWPSTAGTIPANWSRVTALDTRFPKQIPDSTTAPGTTGGTTTHDHTTADHQHTVSHTHITGGSTAAAAGTATHTTVAGVDSQTGTTHTHTVGVVAASADSTPNDANSHPTSDTATNDPARWDTIFIESNGSPTTIPEGAITFFNNATLPPSWTQPANGKDKFLRGAAAAGDGGGTGGGAATHTHAGGSHAHASTHGHPGGTSGAGANVSNSANPADTGVVALDNHTHTYTAVSGNFGSSVSGALATSGTATAAAAEPPWIKQAVITPPAGGDTPKNGIIALWLGTIASIPSPWVLCDGNNGTPNLCQGNFVKGCNLLSELLNTGGNANHTHTGVNHTHTWSSAAHTHTLTVNATPTTGGTVGTAGAGNTASSAAHTHATTTSAAAGTLTVGNAAPALIASTDNNPAYIEVAFIMFSQPGATWLEAVNTQRTVTVVGNVQLRLRIGIKNTGGATGPTAFEYAYSKNSGAYTPLTNASSNVKTFDSTYYADGDDCPQLLTSGNFQTDNNGAEDSTGAFTLTAGLAVGYSAETEIALEVIAADVANADTIDIRVRQADDTVFDTYTVTARIVISKAGVTTHNTRAWPLGMEIGQNWRMEI